MTDFQHQLCNRLNAIVLNVEAARRLPTVTRGCLRDIERAAREAMKLLIEHEQPTPAQREE